jgi:hypothetical protein
MKLAGGPGDRWLGHRKMAGREESPDTVLRHVDHFEDVDMAAARWLTELLTGQRAW